MSLYIRLFNSFWNHRKTLRLKAKIGEAAYWIPPRLWNYAAENQPDGDFNSYSPSEIATILGYPSDAQALLQALHQAGFMDENKIHDWDFWNNYHSTFAERAKKAANARWHPEPSLTLPSDKKGKERKGVSIATSNAQASKRGIIAQRMALAQFKAEHGDSNFKAFWESYPKQVAKGEAIAAWNKLNPSEHLVKVILEAVRMQTASPDWKKEDGKYIPSPAKWIAGMRWEDKIREVSSKPQFISLADKMKAQQ